MKYKCIIKDSLDIWLTEGKVYEAEPMIPPLTEEHSWLVIKKADDGYVAYVRSNQMQRVFSEPDDLNV